VVGRQNADIADTLHPRDVAMTTIFFGFLYMACTLAPTGEYGSAVHVWRWCGLMSNYFDHLSVLQMYWLYWCSCNNAACAPYSLESYMHCQQMTALDLCTNDFSCRQKVISDATVWTEFGKQ